MQAMETIKPKSIVSEVKNSLDGLNRLKRAKLVDKYQNLFPLEEHKERKLKDEQNLGDIGNNIDWCNI